MGRPAFVARRRELELLDGLWKSRKAELLILYGRRRVGKTRLLTHWLRWSGKRGLYWVADPTSPAEQLRSFSQALYNFENPGVPAPDNFAYANWTQAFSQAARLAGSQRLALFIDEFTYLLEAEPGIAGVLQNAWDQSLGEARLFLTLSGSHIGMLQRQVLAYQAPLYGRATARLQLPPLPFAATREYFTAYTAEQRVTLYAMLGGIPAYWEQFDPQQPLEQNLREQFLGGASLLQDEPRLLLQDFLSDIHNYVAILRAIAHGYRTPKEIAGSAGLNEKHISMYLANLISTGLVERRVPVAAGSAAAGENSRLGRHHITDPFLRFYYRFLSRRQVQLALGVADQALAEIQRHLGDFIGMHTWEELCREWVLRASAQSALPFLPDQVGSAWTRQAQVDVAGVNSMERTLILGECKWGQALQERQVLAELAKKAEAVMPKEGQWRVLFLGFARAGWTSGAQSYAQEVERSPLSGENWKSSGMRLLDLSKVDDDLSRWS